MLCLVTHILVCVTKKRALSGETMGEAVPSSHDRSSPVQALAEPTQDSICPVTQEDTGAQRRSNTSNEKQRGSSQEMGCETTVYSQHDLVFKKIRLVTEVKQFCVLNFGERINGSHAATRFIVPLPPLPGPRAGHQTRNHLGSNF